MEPDNSTHADTRLPFPPILQRGTRSPSAQAVLLPENGSYARRMSHRIGGAATSFGWSGLADLSLLS